MRAGPSTLADVVPGVTHLLPAEGPEGLQSHVYSKLTFLFWKVFSFERFHSLLTTKP